MAIYHASAVRNGIANYVADYVDIGGAGTLQFQTGNTISNGTYIGGAEVATLTFSNPAFSAADSAGSGVGLVTAKPITSDTNATGGTVGHFQVFNGSGDSCFAGSVTISGGGGDIILSSLLVGATDTVEITSLTYTAPQ
jgi:hypothetical protein